MSLVSTVADTLFSNQSSGQVEGVNLIRAETASAAGNPSSRRGDTVSLSPAASSKSQESLNTAQANRLSANAAVATRTSDAQSGQAQEAQAVSNIARMQRAYATAAQQSTSGTVNNSFNDLFSVKQAGVVDQLREKSSQSLLSQQVVRTTPAMNVATNPTASSMLLAQQPQVSSLSQSLSDHRDVKSPRQIASVDEVTES